MNPLEKNQVLFSLKNDEKLFMNVVCCVIGALNNTCIRPGSDYYLAVTGKERSLRI